LDERVVGLDEVDRKDEAVCPFGSAGRERPRLAMVRRELRVDNELAILFVI
jgi:hypothetical protein